MKPRPDFKYASEWGIKWYTAKIFKQNGGWYFSHNVVRENGSGHGSSVSYPSWQSALSAFNKKVKSYGTPTRLF